MKREELELSRHNVTPAQFLSYVRSMIRKHNLTTISPLDIQLDSFATGGDIEFEYHDKTGKACKAEKSVSKPYQLQTYVLNWDGTIYNLIMEFDFWDEKTGFGYFYFVNTWNEEEIPTKERIFQLSPNDSHKSFYGKAWVKECSNGEKLLQSYNTVVCMIDAQGHFKRLWHGWSATTQRHINAFLAFYGLQNLSGKANWIEMPIGK